MKASKLIESVLRGSNPDKLVEGTNRGDLKFYGNDNETFVVTGDGRVWLVQSPDTDKAKQVSKLPADVHEVIPIINESEDDEKIDSLIADKRK